MGVKKELPGVKSRTLLEVDTMNERGMRLTLNFPQ